MSETSATNTLKPFQLKPGVTSEGRNHPNAQRTQEPFETD